MSEKARLFYGCILPYTECVQILQDFLKNDASPDFEDNINIFHQKINSVEIKKIPKCYIDKNFKVGMIDNNNSFFCGSFGDKIDIDTVPVDYEKYFRHLEIQYEKLRKNFDEFLPYCIEYPLLRLYLFID